MMATLALVAESNSGSQNALILAPTVQDAHLLSSALLQAGVQSEVHPHCSTLCARLESDSGALLLAEEALTPKALDSLNRVLAKQAPWSDIPIILMTNSGQTSAASLRILQSLDPSGNVTLLERPFRPITLTSALHVALRARKRQYQVRELLQKQSEALQESRKTVEALQVERELRERFVQALTHDLRNPLTAAKMSAQLILRKIDEPEACQNQAGRIVTQINRADQMIRDLLDADRIRAGQPFPLLVQPCDLPWVVRGAVEDLVGIYGDRFELESKASIRGHWDEEGVRRVIENLASNAIKYGLPRSKVTIRLGLSSSHARIAVHNHGTPLSPEEKELLFQPFHRTLSAQASGQKGWGIGHTIVKGVTEAHGGRVSVESGPEIGTTFIVELPLDARVPQSASRAT